MVGGGLYEWDSGVAALCGWVDFILLPGKPAGSLRCRWRRWGGDADWGACGDHAGQCDDVPIGHAETTVGFRAAYGFGFWGPMNSKAGLAETDPIHADGIVRAGGKDEFPSYFLGAGGFREVDWVEGVIWIWREGHEDKLASGNAFQVLGNGTGE